MEYPDRTRRRGGYLGLVLGVMIVIAGCGEGAQTVTDDVPVTDDVVVTEKKVKTDYETEVETEDEGTGADAGNDCPPGEVLSSPGNKCRTADDPDDGK